MFQVFHGGRCAIDPKLRPSTEDHVGVKYCDTTGKAANPANERDSRAGKRSRKRPTAGKKADAVVCSRTPGSAFGGLTSVRNMFHEDGTVVEQEGVWGSNDAPLYKTEGDISKYKSQMSVIQSLDTSRKDRFTPLMWNKNYDAATEEACLRQDTCTPGAGRYEIDRRPKPLQSNSLTDVAMKFPQKVLGAKGSVYARSTAQLGLSSSFKSTVNSTKPKRNDRLSYMNEKGWSFVNDSKLTHGHPVCFQDRDRKNREPNLARAQKHLELIANSGDIGYAVSKTNYVGREISSLKSF